MKKFLNVSIDFFNELEILCFVFKFKELIPFTPMYYFFQVERHVLKRRLS